MARLFFAFCFLCVALSAQVSIASYGEGEVVSPREQTWLFRIPPLRRVAEPGGLMCTSPTDTIVAFDLFRTLGLPVGPFIVGARGLFQSCRRVVEYYEWEVLVAECTERGELLYLLLVSLPGEKTRQFRSLIIVDHRARCEGRR
jgi:hypothetical protein